jgi:hypothetical protein
MKRRERMSGVSGERRWRGQSQVEKVRDLSQVERAEQEV